jgi:hypothetical protein
MTDITHLNKRQQEATPMYVLAKRFFLKDNDFYEKKSQITGRHEIVSFDCSLCNIDEFWNNDDNLMLLEYPLDYDEQIIAYFKNPAEDHSLRKLEKSFEFCGYDLSEEQTLISAITNCGSLFENTIPLSMLNKFGLFDSHVEVFKMQKVLRERFPDEEHAWCEVYELWRKLGSGNI